MHRDAEKWLAWQRRSKRLKSGRPPRRNTPLGKGKPEKRAKRFREAFGSSSYVEMIHAMPCAICGEYGWTQAAHVRRRSQGGKADSIVPLCGDRIERGGIPVKGCHSAFDQYELEEHRLRLASMAKALWDAWVAEHPDHAA